jgi:Uma2 family endonuclease
MTARAANPPRPLTYTEYALIQPDGRRWELLEGDFHVNPAPNTTHQTVSRRLLHQLMLQLEDHGHAVVFNAPTDVILSITTTVQPDLAIVLTAHRRQVSQRGIEGNPDVVVEIISPTNRSYDDVLKRRVYERHGIPEFWLVDPVAELLEVLVLTGGSYVRHALLDASGTLTSPTLGPRVNIPLGKVFEPI